MQQFSLFSVTRSNQCRVCSGEGSYSIIFLLKETSARSVRVHYDEEHTQTSEKQLQTKGCFLNTHTKEKISYTGINKWRGEGGALWAQKRLARWLPSYTYFNLLWLHHSQSPSMETGKVFKGMAIATTIKSEGASWGYPYIPRWGEKITSSPHQISLWQYQRPKPAFTNRLY